MANFLMSRGTISFEFDSRKWIALSNVLGSGNYMLCVKRDKDRQTDRE